MFSISFFFYITVNYQIANIISHLDSTWFCNGIMYANIHVPKVRRSERECVVSGVFHRGLRYLCIFIDGLVFVVLLCIYSFIELFICFLRLVSFFLCISVA